MFKLAKEEFLSRLMKERQLDKASQEMNQGRHEKLLTSDDSITRLSGEALRVNYHSIALISQANH